MKSTTCHRTFITGASQGLGRAFAMACAARGQHLVLVALAGTGSAALARHIEHRFGVRVAVLDMDLSDAGERGRIPGWLTSHGLVVDRLINNVGLGCTARFDELAYPAVQRMIELNVNATVHITHLLLPMLKECGRSTILNVGSAAALYAPPRKQIYAATKAFVRSFSESLRMELKGTGVRVAVVLPGGVHTNAQVSLMIRCSPPVVRWSSMDPADVARRTLAGLEKGRRVMLPGRWNSCFRYLDLLLPDRLKEALLCRQMAGLRMDMAEHLIRGCIPVPGRSSHPSPVERKTAMHRSGMRRAMAIGGPLLLIPVLASFALPPGRMASLAALFTGWAIWTFIEYFVHRFLMHRPGHGAQVPFKKRHADHHAHPRAIRITPAQQAVLLLIALGAVTVAIDHGGPLAIGGGALLGFALYTVMHWMLHQRIARTLFPRNVRAHQLHHGPHPDLCFGVTVTWWDALLGTLPPGGLHVPERIRELYYRPVPHAPARPPQRGTMS